MILNGHSVIRWDNSASQPNLRNLLSQFDSKKTACVGGTGGKRNAKTWNICFRIVPKRFFGGMKKENTLLNLLLQIQASPAVAFDNEENHLNFMQDKRKADGIAWGQGVPEQEDRKPRPQKRLLFLRINSDSLVTPCFHGTGITYLAYGRLPKREQANLIWRGEEFRLTETL